MTIALYKRTAYCCPKEQYKGANLYDYHLNHPHGLVNALTPTLSKKREENGNKIRNTRTTVGTRLDRVRNSLAGGGKLINHGRDPIGSLPWYAYLYIFDAPFWVRNELDLFLSIVIPLLHFLCVTPVYARKL